MLSKRSWAAGGRQAGILAPIASWRIRSELKVKVWILPQSQTPETCQEGNKSVRDSPVAESDSRRATGQLEPYRRRIRGEAPVLRSEGHKMEMFRQNVYMGRLLPVLNRDSDPVLD
ncbi:hypothetical protein FQN55_004393 [Onygenales sp. PD_40]|nr:hypothetical protein FQN55_004393 [Onygenales sp. PD_40]KAK2788976.1 hypothetical protein FQN53_002791 [Emmonsiellopsis sp. PD_33]KAK2796154.1 hypothetical protein FQN52_000131 [Onygenales sp. PD_12]KAK2804029.1 hypothetical protein FQN51_002559 [Onygenales sp. PD_10]